MATIPEDLADNREDRCPLILVLDVSSSMMTDNRIGQLNEGLLQLKNELAEDNLTALRVEIAIVTFGSEATLLQDFTAVHKFQPPMLRASGTTAMGAGMNLALDTVEARKALYRTTGVKFFRPWVWLMSDGAPNDNGWQAAAARAVSAEAAHKAKVFAVGIGHDADLGTLGQFAKEAAPLRLREGRFREMFAWLSNSMAARSKSIAAPDPNGEGANALTASGEQLKLQPVGWGSG